MNLCVCGLLVISWLLSVCCSAPGSAMFIRSRDYRKVVQPMVIWILIFFSASHKVVYKRMHCVMVDWYNVCRRRDSCSPSTHSSACLL